MPGFKELPLPAFLYEVSAQASPSSQPAALLRLRTSALVLCTLPPSHAAPSGLMFVCSLPSA
eukprot:2460734-Prymnesium_polylepis.2